MNIWRMKLRAGSHGPDMWEQCRKRRIASMTDPPILNIDLTNLTPEQVHPDVKTSSRASIRRFAWEIRGGDIIYVGDSGAKQLIARGCIGGEVGARAYRYNSKNAIHPEGRPDEPWRHEIPVVWDSEFEPIDYKDMSYLVTVAPIEKAWREFGKVLETGDNAEHLLSEDDYERETKISKKNVVKLHSALSNRFKLWAQARWKIKIVQEDEYVDTTFELFGKRTMVEFKICYGSHTRRAIREALGQILEYNHFPKRTQRESWWLVLDHQPSEDDLRYADTLRQKYNFPLLLGWETDYGFELSPPVSGKPS